MENIALNEHMNIVIVGHVDHGKSTVIGRLLADTQALPDGKIEQIREMCRRNSKPFEYAFLLDALKDERSQGITIDAARCFFSTAKRQYIIIDAPGHIEFLKNMITGASRAEAALLVIDAKEGICENSRRHGYMLEMLGIKQVSVLINKMDLVGYDESVFEQIKRDYAEFLEKIKLKPTSFIPVSAMEGDNIASNSANMPWYCGKTVLDELDNFSNIAEDSILPFRMPVQDIYKFTSSGDSRRIVAGMIETGSLTAGDEIVFYPSKKTTVVNTVEEWGRDNPDVVSAGKSTGFTCVTQIYTRRGELACKKNEKQPQVGRKFRVSLFWLGREPMTYGGNYMIKIGSSRASVKINKILSTLDASTLDKNTKTQIDKFDIADCVFETDKDIAYDLTSEIPNTGRFVIVENYEISGGGIITASEDDGTYAASAGSSPVSADERASVYKQKPYIFVFTGNPDHIENAAVSVERGLFEYGKVVYRIPEICDTDDGAADMVKKAKALCDAGIIVIAAADMGADVVKRALSSVDGIESKIINIESVSKSITAEITSQILIDTELELG